MIKIGKGLTEELDPFRECQKTISGSYSARDFSKCMIWIPLRIIDIVSIRMMIGSLAQEEIVGMSQNEIEAKKDL